MAGGEGQVVTNQKGDYVKQHVCLQWNSLKSITLYRRIYMSWLYKTAESGNGTKMSDEK